MNVLSEMDENLYDGKMCVFIFNFMHNKYTFFKKCFLKEKIQQINKFS